MFTCVLAGVVWFAGTIIAMAQTERKAFCVDTGLTGYLAMPRELLNLDLPSTAILLYAVLLDRATLSRRTVMPMRLVTSL